MIVYLLRHGIAEDPRPGQTDDERALTDEGIERLTQSCKGYRRLVTEPTELHSSPLKRARQTAEILRQAIGGRDEILIDPCLVPEGDPEDALELIRARQHAGCEAIALVGHEPHLGALLGLLLTGSSNAAMPFKKGMLAAVEMKSQASAIARLVFCLGARQIERLR